MIQITDVFHDGKNWVANILADSSVVELALTDAQAKKLIDAGVPVYNAEES